MGVDDFEGDELLRRCQRGDEAALAELLARFQDRVYRLALRVLGDPARAEDAAADALANVWFRCGSWRGEAAAGTWIHQVALRTVLDHARRRKRWWRFWEQKSTAEGLASLESDPAQALAAEDDRLARTELVERGLARLSPEDRALVHLHYYEGQSLAEIATLLNASRDALKMRLSRLRRELRELWKDIDDCR